MAKLSDVILQLLGDSFLGAGGTNPVAYHQQEKDNLLAQKQAENQRLTSLAHFGNVYDTGNTPIDVPGVGSIPLIPRSQTFLPGTQDTQGNVTFGNPIEAPRGTKPIIGKPSSSSFKTDLSKVSWETASPQQQNLATALYKGDIRPGDLGYRERSEAVILANEYAKKNNLPSFQSYSGETKAGMAKNLAYGKQGLNALSLNTALGHASSAYDAFTQIGNTNQEWLNIPLNTLRKKTNDPNVVKLGTTLTALRGELANVFKNTGGTDQEISQWKDNLNENLTPSQFNAVLPQVDELLRSRLSALEYQQENVMENQPSGRTLISPKAQSTSKKFHAMKNNTLGQTMRVRNKQTKQTGTLPSANFDSAKYDAL